MTRDEAILAAIGFGATSSEDIWRGARAKYPGWCRDKYESTLDKDLQKLRRDGKIRYVPTGPQRGWHIAHQQMCPTCGGCGMVEVTPDA